MGSSSKFGAGFFRLLSLYVDVPSSLFFIPSFGIHSLKGVTVVGYMWNLFHFIKSTWFGVIFWATVKGIL